jgi:hypothetical protein
MWAIGRYEIVNQMTMKIITAEKRMRSAKAPTMRQAVMPAKVAWKATKVSSGITTPLLKVAAFVNVPATGSKMPFRNSRSKPPMKALPVVKASE